MEPLKYRVDAKPQAIVRFAIGCIALFGVSAATAQSGGRDFGRPADTPETRANRALRGSTYCAMKDVPATARKVLETGVGSDEEAKRVKALTGLARKCYRPEWPRFPATAVRNAIAEYTYLTAYRAEPPKLATVLAAAPESFAVVPADSKGTQEQELAWYLAAVANCAVFAGAEPARELVLGPIDVAEEVRRFDALRPAIRKCMTADQDAMLTPGVFRGFVAQALLAQAQAAERR